MEALTPRVRYRDYRQRLLNIRQRHWFVYHRGNIAIARQHNREIELIARLTFGLRLADKIICMQKRNPEGVMEYLLYPIAKILPEDLDEAWALTSEKPVQLKDDQ